MLIFLLLLITPGSNETANGYFLERSHSARLTLEKACELMPDEDGDEGVGGAEGVGAVAGGDLEDRKEGSVGRTLARQSGSGGSITHGVPVQREGGVEKVTLTNCNLLLHLALTKKDKQIAGGRKIRLTPRNRV